MNFFSNILGGMGGGGNDQRLNRGHNHQQAVYQDMFECYPSIFADRHDLEEGNKILLPVSTLDILSQQNVEYPMIFKISNVMLNKWSYVGVLEFTAQEGQCVLPLWLFNNLLLEPGQQVGVSLESKVPKGKYVKIQPHQTEFIEMPDPRAFLEVKLRNYTCLTVGDTINLKLLHNKIYQVDILEVRPSLPNIHAICCVEADVEVDFAEPLDYQQHLHKLKQLSNSQQLITQNINPDHHLNTNQSIHSNTLFSGQPVRIDGKNIHQNQKQQAQQNDLQFKQQKEFDPRKNKIQNGLRQTNNTNAFIGKPANLG